MLCAAGLAQAQQRVPPGIYFRDACEAGERLTIAAVGDLLFHFNLQQQALSKGATFAQLWDPVAHVFKRADIVYGNLEGPTARNVTGYGRELKLPAQKTERFYDRRFYSGGEQDVLIFNYHPSVVADLKAGGFHVVSTANNHSADRGPLGIDRTIDELEANELAFTGTRRRGETVQKRPWSTITRAKGFSVAWLACTYALNGMADPHMQVLECFGSRGETRPEVLDEIRRLAAMPDIDAIMFTPHWGIEYAQQPSAQQRRLAHEAIDAGASAVLGAHPHVLQPWEHYTAADGREALIVYSSGNFVSSQIRTETRTGLISLIELTRAPDRKVRLTAAGYVPTWVSFVNPWRVVENTGKDSAEGLRLTMRLLPPGNRVLSSAMADLPKACGVAAAQASAQTPAADTTGAITPAAPVRVAPKPKAKDRPPSVPAVGFNTREVW